MTPANERAGQQGTQTSTYTTAPHLDSTFVPGKRLPSSPVWIVVAHMIGLAVDQFIGREFSKATRATAKTVGAVEELGGQ